ncbi:MAG: beta-lactamase family protein [Acidobacteria bacterium]|nr:beta-lactamase family protein [Acidobacteriota bacterium]
MSAIGRRPRASVFPRTATLRRTLGGAGRRLVRGAALLAATVLVAAAHAPALPPAPAPPAPSSPAVTSAIPHAYVEYTGAPMPPGNDPLLPPFPDAASAGLDQAALTHLMLRANLFHSDAVVILKDGRLVADARFGKPAGPIEVGSITKSVAGLAIGRLLYTGKIRSLDEPVATWFPEWRGGPKQAITLRQLMNHTSGLAAKPTPEEVYASPNLLRQALAADLAYPPGSHFFYNNKAVNLLAGIVEKASGRKLDEYLRDELFAPLGIARFSWMRDPAGNPHVLAGLRLDARDLARIGQLMLDEGVYGQAPAAGDAGAPQGTSRGMQLQGAARRLLAADFVRESVHAAQPTSPTGGLLWWVIPEWTRLVIDRPLLDAWRQGGADPELLAAVAPLAGREISRRQLFATLDRAFGHEKALTVWVDNVPARNLPTPKVTAGPPIGFDANGALGQYLVVFPADRLVAVRQLRQHAHRVTGDDFEDFPDLVRALVPAGPAKH